MKHKVWFVCVLIAALTMIVLSGCDEEQSNVVSSNDSEQTAESKEGDDIGLSAATYSTWWSNLGQIGRNQAILDRAYRDINRYVGLNCKDWARKVVYDASKGVVTLPTTLPNASGWYFAYSPYLVGMSGGIRSVQPGWIVQINWRLSDGSITPHTFIVVGRSPYGINVIESNWCAYNKVCTRYISFSDFAQKVSRYTCYYVIGG
ncbi:MAG: hypothetical protein WCS88_02625 [Patescibacteria group bacterium]|jgi:hypothetical protein